MAGNPKDLFVFFLLFSSILPFPVSLPSFTPEDFIKQIISNFVLECKLAPKVGPHILEFSG